MFDFLELFYLPETYFSLLTLTLMEIVLGIDNVVFISIVVAKLPKPQQPSVRFIGLFLALFFRVLLLLGVSWMAGLVTPLFSIFSHEVSGRDLILITGGLFLIGKSTMEIHHKFESHEREHESKVKPKFWNVVMQIGLLDIVFSFDSVITAIGLVQHIPIMIIAVVLSMIVMVLSAGIVNQVIEAHPTIKMLALSFLLMIGTMLMVEGFHVHVDKGYIYFAMAFSIVVEILNIKLRKRTIQRNH